MCPVSPPTLGSGRVLHRNRVYSVLQIQGDPVALNAIDRLLGIGGGDGREEVANGRGEDEGDEGEEGMPLLCDMCGKMPDVKVSARTNEWSREGEILGGEGEVLRLSYQPQSEKIIVQGGWL